MEFAGAEGIKNSILYIFRTCEFHSGGLNVPLLGTKSTGISSQQHIFQHANGRFGPTQQ
jgi:hypothetical protein